MKLKTIGLCGILLAACGGQRSTDPAMAQTTGATENEPNTKRTTTVRTTPLSDPNAPARTGVTANEGWTNDPNNSGASQPAGAGNSSAQGSPSYGSSGSGVVSPPPATGAAAVQNPGVADQTKDADNTKINDRDRHGAVTATDTGNAQSETKTTAAIRKAVVADKALSVGAKNVKIVVTGTKVTLRGAVKSAEERTAIENHARAAMGVTEVDNQLEVKK